MYYSREIDNKSYNNFELIKFTSELSDIRLY